MALNKLNLENAIKAALKNHNDSILTDAGVKKSSADDSLAADLADAIYEFILTAEIQVLPGISVATAGSAVSQTGATIAPGEGIIQ